MLRDIFSVKKKQYGPDDLQLAVDRVEEFAPKKYFPEREMYYYNYGQIKKYCKPLLHLLNYISERTRKEVNEELSVQEIFCKLKDFYDVNNKLSRKEAINDYGLIIKLLQLFKIFYDDTSLTKVKVDSYLKTEKADLS
jgi:hypothetical protein